MILERSNCPVAVRTRFPPNLFIAIGGGRKYNMHLFRVPTISSRLMSSSNLESARVRARAVRRLAVARGLFDAAADSDEA